MTVEPFTSEPTEPMNVLYFIVFQSFTVADGAEVVAPLPASEQADAEGVVLIRPVEVDQRLPVSHDHRRCDCCHKPPWRRSSP